MHSHATTADDLLLACPRVTSDQRARVVVLGLGNTLRGDDGFGVRLTEQLRQRNRWREDEVSLIDGGTLSFTLLDLFHPDSALIVADAANLGQAPGSVQLFRNEDLDRFMARPGAMSVHEVSLSELHDMARLSGTLPSRRALIAVQPGTLEWDEALGPEVQTSLAEAVDTVEQLIEEYLQ